MDRIEFDLIDFRSLADNSFKWVLQIKDTFSRYIWLYALEDKSSKSVAKALLEWLGQNGNPWAFCYDNGTEFKG
jgi:transposase InsO family protein